MTKEEADKLNEETRLIYEDLKKKYTLEEIADAFIFPYYRSDEEEKELQEQMKLFMIEHRRKNPMSEEDKKRAKELQDRFIKEDAKKLKNKK